MKRTARRCAPALGLLLVNLCVNLWITLWTAPAWAQEPPPKLGIVVVEGEGAVNNLKDQTVRPTIIQSGGRKSEAHRGRRGHFLSSQ